jgi:hypothetical protein
MSKNGTWSMNRPAACASRDRSRRAYAIGAGMVVAVRIADSQAYTLGNVRWALREGESALVAGIQLFAGDARSVAVRVVEQGSSGQFWQQGFLLPAKWPPPTNPPA